VWLLITTCILCMGAKGFICCRHHKKVQGLRVYTDGRVRTGILVVAAPCSSSDARPRCFSTDRRFDDPEPKLAAHGDIGLDIAAFTAPAHVHQVSMGCAAASWLVVSLIEGMCIMTLCESLVQCWLVSWAAPCLLKMLGRVISNIASHTAGLLCQLLTHGSGCHL